MQPSYPAVSEPQIDWERSTSSSALREIPFLKRELSERSLSDAPLDRLSVGNHLLDIFLGIPDHSPRRDYEVPVLKSMLDGTTFSMILDGQFEESDPVRVWMEDMSSNNEPRPYNGTLPLPEFDRVRKLKRFNEPGLTDVYTRKVHISNPSPISLGVLALMASYNEAPLFRQLMLKYLQMATSINLDSTPFGHEYVFELHIPCFALRTARTSFLDERLTNGGGSLRKSIQLSFSQATASRKEDLPEVYLLHEFQTSVCVFGWNNSLWTAICLSDSYFDETGIRNHNTFSFSSDAIDEISGVHGGNLYNTTIDNTVVAMDPRWYFLSTVRSQMRAIRDEWAHIAENFLWRVREFLKKFRSSTGETFVECVIQLVDVVGGLIMVLKRTIKAWRAFALMETRMSLHKANSCLHQYLRQCMDEITTIVSDLDPVLNELKLLESELELLMRELQTKSEVSYAGLQAVYIIFLIAMPILFVQYGLFTRLLALAKFIFIVVCLAGGIGSCIVLARDWR